MDKRKGNLTRSIIISVGCSICIQTIFKCMYIWITLCVYVCVCYGHFCAHGRLNEPNNSERGKVRDETTFRYVCVFVCVCVYMRSHSIWAHIFSFILTLVKSFGSLLKWNHMARTCIMPVVTFSKGSHWKNTHIDFIAALSHTHTHTYTHRMTIKSPSSWVSYDNRLHANGHDPDMLNVRALSVVVGL